MSGRGRSAGHRRDQGAASIWLLAAGAVVMLVGATGAAAGGASVARHRAAAAADLGALAGAVHAVEGTTVACARADSVVRAHGARLLGCRLDALDVVVSTEVVPGGPARALGTARAAARAGPVQTR